MQWKCNFTTTLKQWAKKPRHLVYLIRPGKENPLDFFFLPFIQMHEKNSKHELVTHYKYIFFHSQTTQVDR